MELGATLCTPKAPACDGCPLRDTCTGRREGRLTELPAPAKARTIPTVERVAVLVERDGAVLLEQRPEEGLLGGLWGLPMTDGTAGPTRADPLGHVAHTFTHRRWSVSVVASDEAPPAAGDVRRRWVPRDELTAHLVSRLDRRVAAAAQKKG